MKSLADLVAETDRYIAEEVLTVGDEYDGDVEAAGGDVLRLRFQAEARVRGIFAPHGPVDCGGMGLSMVDRAPVFEAAGRSLFGPMALNVNAPDEGNVHLLAEVATPAQRERFLRPLVGGVAVRFRDDRTGWGWGRPVDVEHQGTEGRRRLAYRRCQVVTGADGAGFFVVMARTSGDPGGPGAATMFLAPAQAVGIEVVRHIGTQDRSMIGGHCEMRLKKVFVPDENVLGGVEEGFRHAQVRLGPARMTHVMRWTGAAQRAHEVAVSRVAGREAFGWRLTDLGMMQQLIADNEIDLAATRALLLNACDELDAGHRASKAISITKTFAAEALHRVVDRAVQMCGGLGVSRDLSVARIAREIRPFRIYDGPFERTFRTSRRQYAPPPCGVRRGGRAEGWPWSRGW